MLRPCEHTDESPKDQLKPGLRILRRNLRDRRLFSDNEPQIRNQFHHQLSVGIQRLTKGVAPHAKLCLALGQKRPDKALKSLRQRGIRDVAFVLVELPRSKQATGRNQRLMELIDNGGLADTGIAGHKHQLRPAAGDHPVEGG